MMEDVKVISATNPAGGVADKYFSQSGALTDAQYSLSLNARRVLYVGLSKLNVNPVSDSLEARTISISVSDVKSMFNADHRQSRKILVQGIKELNNSESMVKLYSLNGKDLSDNPMSFNWMSGKQDENVVKDGVGAIIINADLWPMICDWSHSLRIHKESLKIPVNKYHFRLWEKLCEFKDNNAASKSGKYQVQIELDWMYERYELPASYKKPTNMIRNFIDPAVKTLSSMMGFEKISYTQIPRPDGKIVAVLFEW